MVPPPTPPSPIHPLSPLQKPHPTLPVPRCWLPLFQLIRSMHGGTMGVLSTRETWNVSECSRPGSLSPLSACFVSPISPRERNSDSESIGGCVNTGGGDRKGMWWQRELECQKGFQGGRRRWEREMKRRAHGQKRLTWLNVDLTCCLVMTKAFILANKMWFKTDESRWCQKCIHHFFSYIWEARTSKCLGVFFLINNFKDLRNRNLIFSSLSVIKWGDKLRIMWGQSGHGQSKRAKGRKSWSGGWIFDRNEPAL